MEIGYFAVGIGPTVDPEWVRTVATTAERLGFSTIWAPEHVVLLDQYSSKYPYSTGKFPWPTDIPIADPLTTLAYAAACTSKIRLATGICLVPEHNPLVLAKTAATLDRLSGGRFILGAGVGWLKEIAHTPLRPVMKDGTCRIGKLGRVKSRCQCSSACR